MITAEEMFPIEDDKLFHLVYSGENGMNAEEMGKAILGMEMCIQETIKILKLKGEYELIVFPIQKGSQKTIFGILKKNKEKIVVATASAVIPALIIGAVNGGISLIARVGANEASKPVQETFLQVQDLPPNVFELCKNKKFLEGAQKIANPLKKEIRTVSIKYRVKIT